MNLNIKKLTALSGVSLLAFLSTFQATTNVDAALTAPSSFDYSYTYTGGTFKTQSGSTPSYVRTVDGAYYNYSATFGIGVDNFEVIQTFNRSNTSWTTAPAGRFIPNSTIIGSDSTVGTVNNKIAIEIDNQTNRDYAFYLDISSSLADRSFQSTLKGNSIYNWPNNLVYFRTNTTMLKLLIPAYMTYTLNSISSSVVHFFDAWYLEDLGVSDAYNAGYTQGEDDGYSSGYADGLGNNPNILLNGFTAMVGILVNFFLMIVNLQVFDISILSLFSIVVVFVGIIWILKIIRG